MPLLAYIVFVPCIDSHAYQGWALGLILHIGCWMEKILRKNNATTAVVEYSGKYY